MSRIQKVNNKIEKQTSSSDSMLDKIKKSPMYVSVLSFSVLMGGTVLTAFGFVLGGPIGASFGFLVGLIAGFKLGHWAGLKLSQKNAE